MLASRWDPFRDLSKGLSQLHREMDDMFRRTFDLTREPEAGLRLRSTVTSKSACRSPRRNRADARSRSKARKKSEEQLLPLTLSSLPPTPKA